jgi:glycosyltransferase involved in cell wall biosynthesis
MPGTGQPTVHFIYPTGPRISTPWAIGRKVTEHLARRFTVVNHELDEDRAIEPAPGDILLGHSWTEPWSVFRRSMLHPGWGRKLLMQPFAPGDVRQTYWHPEVARHCDRFLAITGRHWIETLSSTRLAHLAPKLIHLDLAVDRADFPRTKQAFNPIGRRRFLFIGNYPWYKNLPFLDAIAGRLPEVEFAWMGPPKKRYRHLRQLGPRDFSQVAARVEAAGYDFMITTGSADANPTTILEAMAWGLIPVCTPQSGYSGYAGIPNVPLDDVAGAAAIVTRLQQASAAELEAMRADNDRLLDSHFTWPRFCAQVEAAIDDRSSPPLTPEPLANRLMRLAWAQRSPFRWWRWRTLRHRARDVLFPRSH